MSQDITQKRALNRIRARLDATFLSPEMQAFPSVFFIGVSSICDISCPYCPRQYYCQDVDQGVMDFDDFMKIAPFFEYAEETNIFGLGEPFLHPRFFDFLSEAKKRGVKVSTSTHGMSLTPANREELIKLEVDEISVSVDAADKKTFEFLRKGADFETVISNIENLQKEKKQQGKSIPSVSIATAVSIHNVTQMKKIVSLASNLGADRIVFTDLIIVDPENSSLSVSKTNLFEEKLISAIREGEKKGVEALYFFQNPFPWKEDPLPELIKEPEGYFCADPWKMCILDRTGRMQPCCYYPPKTGNPFEHTLPDVLNNEENMSLRRNLLKGNLPDCCINCGMLQKRSAASSMEQINNAEELLHEYHKSNIINDEDVDKLNHMINEYKKLHEKFFNQNQDK